MFKYRKNFIYWEGRQALEQAAQVSCGVSVGAHAGILAGFQKLTGQDPEQPAVIDPALSRVVGLDHLQSFLPTSAVL